MKNENYIRDTVSNITIDARKSIEIRVVDFLFSGSGTLEVGCVSFANPSGGVKLVVGLAIDAFRSKVLVVEFTGTTTDYF